MHPQLRKLYVPQVVPLQLYPDHLLSVDSQEYVCICVHRCLLFLWSVKPFYLEWLGEANSSTLSISRIGSKQLYSADQMQSSFDSILPWSITHFYVRNVMRIAPSLMNSWCSDTYCHHCSFLGSRVIVTGMLASESWCVKSILLATPLLGS